MPNQKLSISHEISEENKKAIFGEPLFINQTMIVTVDYNSDEDTFDVLAVDIYQNGVFIAEISKLLHKAEGNPLNTIVEAVNWQEIYSEQNQPA